MIDSHTHLDSCEPPNAELVAAARAAGVRRILTVGMDEASNRTAIAAANGFDEVFAAVGRHPNAATGFSDTALEDLDALARDEHVVAIGETGLDFFRDRAGRADQEVAFRAQAAIARANALPLIIHTRAAEQETLDMLRVHAAALQVVLHCFSMPERLEECLAEGWWISFAGNVTYPKNTALADAAARVPEDRILVETDAPYLTPQAVRKERNQPAFVAHTARFVAERRGTTYEQLEADVERNAAELFGW